MFLLSRVVFNCLYFVVPRLILIFESEGIINLRKKQTSGSTTFDRKIWQKYKGKVVIWTLTQGGERHNTTQPLCIYIYRPRDKRGPEARELCNPFKTKKEKKIMLPVRQTKRVLNSSGVFMPTRKRRRCVPSSVSPALETNTRPDLLDSIPNDLVVSILCRLASTSRCPADFISVSMT